MVGVTCFLFDEEPTMVGLEVLEDSEVLARTSSSRDDCLASSLSILVPMFSNWLLTVVSCLSKNAWKDYKTSITVALL